MTEAGAKLIDAVREAVSIARGEQPAGRLHHNGHSYVPEADYATLEAALRTIRSAIPGYLKGEMSEHDFALLVLGEVDSAKVNKALEVGNADRK